MTVSAKFYDCGDYMEAVAYCPSDMGFSSSEKKDRPEWISKSELDEHFTEEEKAAILQERNDDNIRRSVQRSRTEVRRKCRKYKLRYMWTLTMAAQDISVMNPTNNRVTKYDAGDIKGAWKLWELFLQRCRKAGFNFNYVVTIELQEERLSKHGQRCYHFHFATDEFLPVDRAAAMRSGMRNYMTKLWTFGFCFATKNKSPKKMANDYLMKYITKAFEDGLTGKHRYRAKQGMIIPVVVRLEGVSFDQVKELAESYGFLLVSKEIEMDSGPPIYFAMIEKFEGV